MLVQLGVVGVALCAILLAAAYILALVRTLDRRDGDWALIYLSIFLITTFSESVLMQRNSLTWTLCIATVTKILSDRRVGRPVEDRKTNPQSLPYDLWPPDPIARL
jgi:O-antigen ligase